MRIGWTTDVHLDVAGADVARGFATSLPGRGLDVLLIGGDIGDAFSFEQHLRAFEPQFLRPIYFVLGNHDFYGSSISEICARAGELARQSDLMTYLSQEEVIELTPTTALVGHDGWADGRLGNWEKSEIMLNDYWLIAELSGVGKAERLEILNRLGDEAAAHLEKQLTRACRTHKRIILLTHVPPWTESCWYQGKPSNDDYLPHFASKAAGDAINGVMQANPDCELTVLCGHTHGAGESQILPNVFAITAWAEYGAPTVQKILEIE